MAYLGSHHALAGTASSKPFVRDLIPDEQDSESCKHALFALTGFSETLLSLISGTTELAHDTQTAQPTTNAATDLLHRRKRIEQSLHDIHQPVPPDDDQTDVFQFALIAETKRLAALLYLYSRIDDAGPREQHMVDLTARLLSLLGRISLRTNTTLWPLFIVGTLGVRPEDDELRGIILERLASLQETRQLGNVKRARAIVEDVWKVRDLKKGEADRGWSILGDRYGTISLA